MEGKQFYLRIGNIVFPVIEQEYREYYRELERRKYIRRLEKGKKLSYEQALEDGLPLERLGAEEIPSLEDEIEKKIMIDRMLEAIELLEEDEKRLIRQLYFDGLTVREIANQEGVFHRSIVYRKDKVLNKLRKFMKI